MEMKEVGTRDVGVSTLQHQMGSSMQVGESGDPEAFPISSTSFPHDLQAGIWKATRDRRQLQVTMLNCRCLHGR